MRSRRSNAGGYSSAHNATSSLLSLPLEPCCTDIIHQTVCVSSLSNSIKVSFCLDEARLSNTLRKKLAVSLHCQWHQVVSGSVVFTVVRLLLLSSLDDSER